MKIRLWVFSILVLAVLLRPGDLFSQDSQSFSALEAQEDVRYGVLAFHSGYYNDALLAFQRAIAQSHDKELVRRWMGRAYAQSGFWDAAIAEWKEIIRAGEAGLALQQRVEIFEERMGLGRELFEKEQYVLAAEISGITDRASFFRRPTSVRSLPDGSNLVVSFVGHKIAFIDPNGNMTRQLQGGIGGLDGPYDVVSLPDGGYLVSEFSADRVSRLNERGDRVASFGTAGSAPGQMLGPQFISLDDTGHVYVSDWGNRRVHKYTVDGEFLFSAGGESPGYSGLERPVGVLWWQNALWVTDAKKAVIEIFDASGNHLRTISNEAFISPQSLAVYDDNTLLITDRNRILLFNVSSSAVAIIKDGATSKISSASLDANGNIVAVDHDLQTMVVFTPVSQLYAGMHITIQRIVADEFPLVHLEVTVEDRAGNPIVGLDKRNFVISDSMGATQDIQMEFAGWRSSSVHSMMIAIPGAPNHRYADILGSLVEQQYGLRQENDSFQIVVAAENPRIEVDTRDAALAAGQTARRLLSSGQSAGSLDIAIRYAASELLQRRGRRHLIIASSAGEYLPEFQTYGIIELARYCQINHINVSVLKLGQGEIDDRLQYLVEETGGTVHSDADPKGIAPLMQHGRQMPSGWYSLSYSSLANNDFGRRYLPITVEAMLLQRSGRDELGYFSPLEF